MNKSIVLADFISHQNMHLPFNQGLLKTLRFAYPEHKIVFAAGAAHVEELKKLVPQGTEITYEAVSSLKQLLNGRSEHNPLYSLPAAKKSWLELDGIMAKETVDMMLILGVASPLLNVFSKKWKKSQQGKLYFVQHNQLATSMNWRSANPFFKHFDYISALQRGLPEKQKLLTLELGLDQVIEDIAPKMQGSIACLEHPVLQSEWAEPQIFEGNRPLRVGFTGHCGRGKGLDVFVELAEKYTSERFEFHAIGKLNKDNAGDLDTSALKTEPQQSFIAREDFVRLLSQMDVICLPLPNKTSYVSSGSIIDAFAALKPLVMTYNQSLDAIEKKYGEFGLLTQSKTDLEAFFEDFDSETFKEKQKVWHDNLRAIRLARSEKVLGQTLADVL